MATTKVLGELIADNTIASNNVDNSVVKTITLTQAEYDALPSYSASTIYITT
jgi:hypothetical protein